MRGRLHIKNTQTQPFYSSIPILPFLISHYPLQNFHTRKKDCGSSLYFSFFFFCIRGYQSSNSRPSEENFMKRVQIQDDEEAQCKR